MAEGSPTGAATSLRNLPLENLTPSRLWTHLAPEVRTLAARSLYARDWGETTTRREADLAIAGTLRFREIAVRKLPVGKRIEYLARAVRPPDQLAASLLLALHLEHRRSMLSTFLEDLGIRHERGLITDAETLGPPQPDVLGVAVVKLFESYPPEQVDIYLATLLSADPEIWGGLLDVLKERWAAD